MANHIPIPIKGVWVRREFPHLGGKLEVLVELDDGWHIVQTHDADGYISHITEIGGIKDSPLDAALES